jgi:hypothetical protein
MDLLLIKKIIGNNKRLHLDLQRFSYDFNTEFAVRDGIPYAIDFGNQHQMQTLIQLVKKTLNG